MTTSPSPASGPEAHAALSSSNHPRKRILGILGLAGMLLAGEAGAHPPPHPVAARNKVGESLPENLAHRLKLNHNRQLSRLALESLKKGNSADLCDRIRETKSCWAIHGSSLSDDAKDFHKLIRPGAKEKPFEELGFAIKEGNESGGWLFAAVLTTELLDLELKQALFLAELNEFRRRHLGNIQRVQNDECLEGMASYWASFQAKEGWHEKGKGHGSGKNGFHQRSAEAQCEMDGMAENVARVISPSTLVGDWAKSPGHRKNMLKPNINRIGIACARGEVPEHPNLGDNVCVLVLGQATK